jgi:ribosomal protein S18 acetylase RimI-like enzyme
MPTDGIRPLRSEDFRTLVRLEARVFGTSGDGVVGPCFLRLCCEFFADTCFLSFVEGKPAGYLLCFVRGATAYCSTVAVLPEHRGGRVALGLTRRLMEVLAGRVDSCCFMARTREGS